MTDILDRLFDRSYDLEETLHDAHTEIKQLRKALKMPPPVNMAATILARRFEDGEPIGDLENCVAVVLTWARDPAALGASFRGQR